MSFNRVKPGFWLALIATIVVSVVVVLGAFTRLVDAGLGCPDWPTCYGHFWAPTTEGEIAVANSAYPDIPVDLNKTWPEMVHRYFASGLGLFIIAITVVSFRHRKSVDQPFKLPLFLLFFVIVQGIFGAWTVTLKLLPQVVTGHLIGGFTTFTLLVILTLRLSGIKFRKISLLNKALKPKKLAALTLFAVILQIFLGGWTTSNYAAMACPDLFTCQAQWWPEADFKTGFDILHPIGPNYQGGALDLPARIAIHLSHRIGAIVVSVLSLMLIGVLFLRGLSVWALGLTVLLTIQVSLGLSNVHFGLPLSVAVLHNLFGALLLIYLAVLNLVLNRKEPVYV
ncbi:COX15/CtaA family protein [Reinekea sp.]|jgi:cytochrome c oxidase assembly protein subunit 15|uniref:COX15/CtaA family protein n=1 Tax=Reinekea sp. TaxID=1970455 RepID=UPI00398A0EB0